MGLAEEEEDGEEEGGTRRRFKGWDGSGRAVIVFVDGHLFQWLC